MKKTLGLILAAVMLMPGQSFAQAVSGVGLSGTPLGTSGISVQLAPGAASLSPLAENPLTVTALAPSLIPAAAAPAIATPQIAVPAALAPANVVPAASVAAPLIQAKAQIVKGEESASVLSALFDGGRSVAPAYEVAGTEGVGAPALARTLSAPSISHPGGPNAPKPDYARAAWRQKITEYKGRFVHWVSTTPSEILLVGILGLAVGVGLGHKHESDREKHIPLGFSEIHQIERDAERAGAQVGPLARYLTSANDMTMKVFESWDLSHEKTYVGSNVKDFASELEYKMDPSFKFHRYELFDFMRDMPAQADAATAKLAQFGELRRGLSPVVADFDRSWDDSHVDHYRTEFYTVTVDDGKGKSHTETRTRQVYDHTTHTYDYHRDAGERASAEADALIARTAPLKVDEVFHPASQTNAEGEYAAEKSRREENGGKRLTQEELTKIANTWLTGSTLNTNLKEVDRLWTLFHGDADSWRGAKRTAHSDWYNTGSHYDSGPREFQVAEKAHEDGAATEAKLGEILDGITFVKDNTPKLESMVRELIAVELHGQKATTPPEKLMRQILTLSQQMYEKNFNGGFEVDPYRWSMILIYALCGMALGAGLGAALDKLSRKYRWY